MGRVGRVGLVGLVGLVEESAEKSIGQPRPTRPTRLTRPTRPTRLFRSPPRNRDFHMRVRPAALKPASAFAGSIVHLDADDVLTRRSEGRGRREPALFFELG